jgi:hypothetical protein
MAHRTALGAVRLALTLFCVASSPLTAQATRTITGFGMGYAPPAGWTIAGTDGRVEAWGRTGAAGALVVYGGSYSSGEFAIADGGTVLQGVAIREPVTVLEPAARRTVRGVEAWTSAARVQTERGDVIILRILARPSGSGTMLGVVSMAAPADDAAFRDAAEQLLTTVRPGTPVADKAAAGALVGSWRRQESNMSSNGGYVNEEGWDLRADGTFVHWTANSVSLPGAAVEPTRTQQAGRWEIIGGALVISAPDGRMTLVCKQQGQVAMIGGSRFLRR